MVEKKYYILCFEDNKLVEIGDFNDVKDVEVFKEKKIEEDKEITKLRYETHKRQQAMYNRKIDYLLEKLNKEREGENKKSLFEKLKNSINCVGRKK